MVGMFAYVNLFQQFYGVGGSANYSDPLFDYRLEQILAMAQVFRQIIWKGFYVGALVGYTTYRAKTDDPATSGQPVRKIRERRCGRRSPHAAAHASGVLSRLNLVRSR